MVGIPALSIDTCARIMAVLMVHGNNEAFTHNTHFLADVEYIQEKYQLYGSGVPPMEFAQLLRKYVRELENVEADDKPEWVKKLFGGMYDINL